MRAEPTRASDVGRARRNAYRRFCAQIGRRSMRRCFCAQATRASAVIRAQNGARRKCDRRDFCALALSCSAKSQGRKNPECFQKRQSRANSRAPKT